MNYHPLANLFPLMDGREFDELVTDIRAHGLREPIWIYDGQILDGRNRFRACQAAGIEPVSRIYEGDDALGFVISLNLHRRHLDESQRAMVAGKLANMSRGRPADNPSIGGITAEKASEMLNVGTRSIERARDVIDRGAPELIAAVERGNISVSAAADVAELPRAEQAEIVARGEGEILEAAKKIRAARSEVRREERVERIASLSTPDLPGGRYPVIYADPPWRYEFAESESRAIENQYPTMDLDAICALPVIERATDDAILFMWATSPKLAESMRVIDAWGFTYRSSAVWVKPQLGMGYYFRQQHELLLVATRGNMPAPAPAARPRSVYESPREAHSAKPPAFYEFIESMYPTLPKVELFARAPREGWAGWGNQLAA